jgi:hypothetical protein
MNPPGKLDLLGEFFWMGGIRRAKQDYRRVRRGAAEGAETVATCVPTGVPCQWREADDIVGAFARRVGEGLARAYVVPLQLLTGLCDT